MDLGASSPIAGENICAFTRPTPPPLAFALSAQRQTLPDVTEMAVCQPYLTFGREGARGGNDRRPRPNTSLRCCSERGVCVCMCVRGWVGWLVRACVSVCLLAEFLVFRYSEAFTYTGLRVVSRAASFADSSFFAKLQPRRSSGHARLVRDVRHDPSIYRHNAARYCAGERRGSAYIIS